MKLVLSILGGSVVIAGAFLILGIRNQDFQHRLLQAQQALQPTNSALPATLITKALAPFTSVDSHVKIERCKANAVVVAQNAIDNYLPPQSSCGDDMECTANFTATWASELQFLKRTTYDKSYAACLNRI